MDSPILRQIFFCLASFSVISAIPSSIPTVNTAVNQLTESQIIEQNSTNETNIEIKPQNNQKIQISTEIKETKINDSLIPLETTTGLPSVELDINNRIDGPVDQLTELNTDQINRPSLETKSANSVVSDETQTKGRQTILPSILTDFQNISHENDSKNISQAIVAISPMVENVENKTPSNITVDNSVAIQNENMTKQAIRDTPNEIADPIRGVPIEDNHRIKRSFLRSSLHSNLDELLNMKRQRRASMRSKRNTNYEDLLASLLAAEEAKYNDNYDSFADKNQLNALAMNYILNNMNSGDSDNKNIDLDKLSQYYYENLLPLIDSIDTDSDSTSDEENQEMPIIFQPYSQSSIPVLPFSMSNRYQRIRRSYYDRYRNPISLYTGLKRKRGQNRGGWGRIVGANSERTSYEDEAQEANKIYSLASLLATGSTPEDNRLRYKRSVKRSVKPIVTLKNM